MVKNGHVIITRFLTLENTVETPISGHRRDAEVVFVTRAGCLPE